MGWWNYKMMKWERSSSALPSQGRNTPTNQQRLAGMIPREGPQTQWASTTLVIHDRRRLKEAYKVSIIPTAICIDKTLAKGELVPPDQDIGDSIPNLRPPPWTTDGKCYLVKKTDRFSRLTRATQYAEGSASQFLAILCNNCILQQISTLLNTLFALDWEIWQQLSNASKLQSW